MNGKKLTGWSAVLAAIAAAILAARGGHHNPPPPPPDPPVPTYTLVAHICRGDCAQDHKLPGASITLDGAAVGILADSSGNGAFEHLPAGHYHVCAALTGYVQACRDHNLPADGEAFLELTADVPPIVPLRADGRIFRQGDQPWRWKGVSAFQLLDRFAKGEDLAPFLEAYKGYNLLRVWPYVPRADWGAAAWDAPSPDVTVAFLARVARDGWYVELTLLLDDDPARVQQAAQLVDVLKAARPPNLLIEIGNEPKVHKDINTRLLKAALDASGFLYASGDSSVDAFGSYLTAHTARTVDFSRRAHDLLEYWNGGGPDAPTDPPHKVPAVADEPGKLEDVGTDPAAWRAYFGAASLFGAGVTFHSQTGKFAQLPTPTEARLAAVALDAMNAFPADAPGGAYRRIVEPGQSDTGRTYVIGNFMVRCQQSGKSAPESGWVPLDDLGVLWRR